MLDRDGRPEASPLDMPLVPGDRLRTQNGRAEVLFGDGACSTPTTAPCSTSSRMNSCGC